LIWEIEKLQLSKSIAIYGKSLHQQTKVIAMVGEKFMGIIGTHSAKLNNRIIQIVTL
jgi:hypothetical protein